MQKNLPVKSGKTKVRDRYFHYVVLRNGANYFLKERTDKDVWSGLFDFHLIEGRYEEEEVLNAAKATFQFQNLLVDDISAPLVHILSHQKIYACFYLITISDEDAGRVRQNHDLKSFSEEEILNLPKPKLIVNYLERLGIK